MMPLTNSKEDKSREKRIDERRNYLNGNYPLSLMGDLMFNESANLDLDAAKYYVSKRN